MSIAYRTRTFFCNVSTRSFIAEIRARSISASDSLDAPFKSLLEVGDEGDPGRPSELTQVDGVDEDVNENSPDEYCELDCAWECCLDSEERYCS